MPGKKQKISMFLNENRKQAELLRTCCQLADCSISLPVPVTTSCSVNKHAAIANLYCEPRRFRDIVSTKFLYRESCNIHILARIGYYFNFSVQIKVVSGQLLVAVHG